MKEKFLDILRTTKQNVFVLSAGNPSNRQAMTASSVISLSLEPVSMMVSVNQEAAIHDLLKVDDKFCLNLLSSKQRNIAEICSGSEEGEKRFEDEDWDLSSLPFLKSSQSNIFCVCKKIIPLYSHSLMVGNVEAINHSGEMHPLIYQNGSYED